jgi:predicted phage-related endonuclease
VEKMSTIEIEVTARTYRTIQAEIKALQEKAAELKQKMICEMETRQVEKLAAGEYTLCYSVFESNHLDSAKLKAEHASLYAAYCKSFKSSRFQVA